MTAAGWVLAGAMTRGGRLRQEDAYAVWPEAIVERSFGNDDLEILRSREPVAELLIVAADGMGGHAGGAEASRTAVSAFRQAFAQAGGEIGDRLRTALWQANEAVVAMADARPELSGAGSTLTAVALSGLSLCYVSVGDSPLFVLGAHGLRRLNADHSLRPVLAEAVRQGQMTQADAERHPDRNALIWALGSLDLSGCEQPTAPHDLAPGDLVLLATDGLLTLSEKNIVYLLREPAPVRPCALLDRLLAGLAQEAPVDQDNTTVFILAQEGHGGRRP
jgi:PPM family protein phosphatase